MQLRILCVGKLKQPGLEALVDDYCKRSCSLLQIDLLALRDMSQLRERVQGSPRDDHNKSGPRVVVDERGEQITTGVLATWLSDWRDRGVRSVDFLIGDAHGFTDDDRKSADRVLALSRLTLPHRLAQVLLVEQLYRAGTILAGHPYHHE
jgi:23S rRNA (pseudouridine1915-N3)-methyltransferase